MNRVLKLFAVIIFAGVLMSGCGQQEAGNNQSTQETSPEPQQMVKQVEPTHAVPPLEAAPIDNGEVKATAADLPLGDLMKRIENRSGKPLFLNIWASWCAPCRTEMPHIVELYNEYKNKVDFMAVSIDSFTGTKDDVPQAMKELNMNLPTFVISAEKQGEVINKIDEKWEGSIPATFLYNSQGKKVNHFEGAKSKETFKQAINDVLKG